MGKFGLTISVFVFLAAGCSLTESTESEIGSNTAPAPAVEQQPSPAPTIIEPVRKELAAPPRRQPTPEDIRRLQTRLREVGLDPGPVDGIAGAKTKFALARFQSGCAQVKTLLDGGNDASPGGSSKKSPNRGATLSLQTQFRNAGFNPGPVDGIFGERTKFLLTQLRSGCPMAEEFASSFDIQPQTVAKEQSSAPAREEIARPHAVGSPARMEGVKPVSAAVQPVRGQEEIRILQLRLRDAGYDPGPFDGVMGPKTKMALQQYEAAQRNGKIKTSLTARSRGE
jgi:peptidoglycan hydrolase-like protein with peptidoglycan-binding domain